MAYEEELREIFGDEKECHRMMLPYRIDDKYQSMLAEP